MSASILVGAAVFFCKRAIPNPTFRSRHFLRFPFCSQRGYSL